MLPDNAVPRAFRSGWTAFRVALQGPLTDFWVYEDQVSGTLIGNASAGFASDEIVAGPIRFEDMRPGCYDATARLADMDLEPRRTFAVLSDLPRFCGQTFLNGPTRISRSPACAAYNDFMVDEWAGDSGGRLIPLCLIPLWDARLAADEVRRNAARGRAGGDVQ